MKKLKLAGIGCGGRTLTYISLAIEHLSDRFELTAVADPITERTERFRRYAPEGLRVFSNADELLAKDKLADVVIIGTQDSYHVEPCIKAMEKGYDVLLEKPVSNRPDEVVLLEREAKRLGRRVMVCHVLRYAPLYQTIRKIIDSGELGEIKTVNASEGVGPWHFAHSYVRGHWAVKENSSPIMLAKCCHDMDILSWLTDAECISLSSSGELGFFNSAHAPDGAPARCTDGCPAADNCTYNALRYASNERKWLEYVFDTEAVKKAEGSQATDKEVRDWLAISPWGRCVFHCDNNVPDHQTVNIRFTDGITATFTLSAFAGGRGIEIHGTKGQLKGGTAEPRDGGDISILDLATGQTRFIDVLEQAGGYDGHEGGDIGLVSRLYDEMTCPPEQMLTSISQSVQSHLMSFAAEESRLTDRTVDLSEFTCRLASPGFTD
jgi:predicted dehydrogenase